MEEMVFGGIQRFSTIDFPGAISCVLFAPGCDLDCFYCHNRALLGGGDEVIQAEAALEFLKKRRGLLEGVVVSGGEPTLRAGLPGFLEAVRGLGYRIKLDTNGQRPETVLSLWRRGLMDYAAVDVKATREDYPSVTGRAGFDPARETVEALKRAGAPFEARTTLYPGLTLEALERILASVSPLSAWRLNFFRMPEAFREADAARLRAPALSRPAVEAAADRLRALQPGLIY